MLCFSLIKGMKIVLNNKTLTAKSPELFISENSRPYFVEGDIDDVHYKIVAGLGRIGEPKLSGWYVFCNNRLVLEGDQTSLTGWGVNSIPKWHIDYVMFRGFVFLDSQETSKLPLTTTKKGLDASSTIYRKILPHMRNGMIRVTSFLKAVTGLKEEANDYRKLIGDTSDKMNINDIRSYYSENVGEKSFVAPVLDLQKIAEKKDTVRVAYDVSKKTADVAKNNADVSSYKELGKTTFKYYIKWRELIMSKSAVTINYEIRPCKFVERRMLLASLSRILGAIRKEQEYQYIGFGGCSFTDFKLFHRELQINQ